MLTVTKLLFTLSKGFRLTFTALLFTFTGFMLMLTPLLLTFTPVRL